MITSDEDKRMFRGDFLGLNGSADFYANSVDGLQREGRASLHAFLQTCEENGIEPYRSFSGKFNVRIPEALHAAAARGISLNDLVREALAHEMPDRFGRKSRKSLLSDVEQILYTVHDTLEAVRQLYVILHHPRARKVQESLQER